MDELNSKGGVLVLIRIDQMMCDLAMESPELVVALRVGG
jgi:hypothetical protein